MALPQTVAAFHALVGAAAVSRRGVNFPQLEGVPMENHGKSSGTSWEIQWQIMANPVENHGKIR